MPLASARDFTELDSLETALLSGDVALVKGSWLISAEEHGQAPLAPAWPSLLSAVSLSEVIHSSVAQIMYDRFVVCPPCLMRACARKGV